MVLVSSESCKKPREVYRKPWLFRNNFICRGKFEFATDATPTGWRLYGAESRRPFRSIKKAAEKRLPALATKL